MRQYIILQLIFLLLICNVKGQELFHGLPCIRNYSSEDYKSIDQVWNAVQSKQGIMYFGNTNGLLKFDGITWHLYPISKFMSIVRSMEISKNGIIFVGSIDNFGMIVPTQKGDHGYYSLSDNLPHGESTFGDIWQIACYHEFTFFMSEEKVFIYKNFKLFKTINAVETFTMIRVAGNNLYLQDKGQGLFIWKNSDFKLACHGDFFTGKRISFIVEYPEKKLLVGTTENRIYVVEENNTKVWADFSQINEISQFSCCKVLNNQNLAIGTTGSGIIFVNSLGKIISRIGIQQGLIGNGVNNLFIDRQNNVWVTTDNGISFLELNSPFTYYLSPYGLTQPIMEAAYFNEALYIAGIDAVYSMTYKTPNDVFQQTCFNQIDFSQGESWKIKKNSNKLYIAHNPGLIVCSKENVSMQPLNFSNVYDFVFPFNHPDKMIVSVDRGLLLIDKSTFSFKRIWSGKHTPRYIELDRNGDVWMIAENLQGVYRIKFSNEYESFSTMWYSSHKGLPDVPVLSIVNTPKGLDVLTPTGLYQYQAQSDCFTIDDCTNKIRLKDANLANADSLNNIWLGGMNYLSLLNYNRSGDCFLKDTIFRRIHSFTILHSVALPDSSWILSTNKGLIRYCPDKNYIPKVFKPIINKVQCMTGDSLIINMNFPQNGVFPNQNKKYPPNGIEIPYEGNSLRFICASGNYIEPEKCEFRYKLDTKDGNNGIWSEWTKSSQKEFTNLSEGSYTFSVVFRDVFGQISPEATFSFIILPPWYRTNWAYAAYLILIIILFRIGNRISHYRLKKANVRLEKTIEERTKKIQLQNKEIESLSEFKSRFYSNISHELRTPLTLIIGPLEQLDKNNTNPSQRKQFEIMLRNARRLQDLINQLIDLARLEKNNLPTKGTQMSIGPVINQIVESFSQLALIKNISLNFVDNHQSIVVSIDQDVIVKILTNLLSNAFKFTRENGSISLILTTTDDFNFACIKVSDTGDGIPENDLPYIFDRFFQSENSIHHIEKGVGIGLSFVKELIDRYNGQIHVESTIGKGSTFTVLLPLARAHNDLINTGDEWKTKPSEDTFIPSDCIDSRSNETENHKNKTVLIVEDNFDMLNFITESIENNYSVLKAHNGEEGLETAIKSMPDLIISDVMMPIMNGFDMTVAIKSNRITCHIPIILLTAKSSTDNKVTGFESFADDYITKPFSIRELLARISNLIALREKLRSKYQEDLIVNPGEVTTSIIDEEFLAKAIKLVEENFLNPKFDIPFLCEALSMSRPTLHRKLKAITNQSTSEFINSVRIKNAAQLIRKKAGTIAEIAYSVGFNSVSYFNVTFKRHFGVPPSEY